MKFINIGGATAILEHKGKRMLFDPWLDEGIFHGSWFHYPPLQIGIKDLGRFDYIYISHIHEDHCAAGTIRNLNLDAEVILMDRQPNYVLKFLKSHGFNFKKIHLVKPRTPTQISPDILADMLEGDPSNRMSFMVDSALILNWEGFVIYNANDCPQYAAALEYVRGHYPKLDLALLPYAGGSGYPACYTNLLHEEKLKEKERIFRQKLKTFVEAMQFLKPRYTIPFADQYVIGGSRAYLNQYLSHPSCPGAVSGSVKEAGLEEKVLLLNSGQGFDFSENEKVPNEPYKTFTEENRLCYMKNEIAKSTYDHEKVQMAPGVSVRRLVEYARARLLAEQKKQNYFPTYSYYLEIPDKNQIFHVPLDSEKANEVEFGQKNLKQPYLKIAASNTLMIWLLIGNVSWNIADAALFLDYERIPNVYDTKIYEFLNYLRV